MQDYDMDNQTTIIRVTIKIILSPYKIVRILFAVSFNKI